jgi:hypothetical protein
MIHLFPSFLNNVALNNINIKVFKQIFIKYIGGKDGKCV